MAAVLLAWERNGDSKHSVDIAVRGMWHSSSVKFTNMEAVPWGVSAIPSSLDPIIRDPTNPPFIRSSGIQDISLTDLPLVCLAFLCLTSPVGQGL